MVNLGGGFPAHYVRKTPKLESYGKAIFRALRKHFGNAIPETIVEPGRGLVGNAGMIEAEVVLIAKRSPEDEVRWVYLDIGKFHGLAETIDESIRYPIRTRTRPRRDGALHHRRPDLRLGRRAVREDAVPAAGLARDRRQGADRGDRRLYDDLFVGRLQRLSAAEAIRDLSERSFEPQHCSPTGLRSGQSSPVPAAPNFREITTVCGHARFHDPADRTG